MFLKRSGAVLVNTVEGLPITINLSDLGQVMHFYFPYCPELQTLLCDLLLPGDTCIDLGANSGVLTAIMAHAVGTNGIILAVDPNPANIAQIQNTVTACNLSTVKPVLAGVAGRDGNASFSLPPNGRSESGELYQQEERESGVTVRTMTINTMREEMIPDRLIDFIKYDVEGMEAELLDSLAEVFHRDEHPILLVEFHPQKIAKRQGNHQQVREMLRGLGYLERHVIRERNTYRLQRDESILSTNANILYLMPEHIKQRERIQCMWGIDDG